MRSRTYSSEHFSIALQDAMLCFEMPLFAAMHLYAFSHRDYLPSKLRTFSGRLPFVYAFRDSLLGYKDVLDDSLTTFRGTGFSYRTFEPAEGGLHSNTGDARARRARAGLRYADGGKTKYWLPMPGANAEEAYGRRPMRAPAIAYVGTDASDRLVDLMEHPMESTSGTGIADFLSNPIQAIGRKIRHQRDADRGYAPIAPEQADEVVHIDPRYVIDEEAGTTAEHLVTRAGVVPFAGLNGQNRRGVGGEASSGDASTESRENMLEFEDIEEDGAEERIYEESRQLEFGDYNYREFLCRQYTSASLGSQRVIMFAAVLDASKEEARQHMREIEDEFIKGRRGEWRNSLANVQRSSKFEISKKEETAARKKKLNKQQGKNKKKLELPAGCVDILVEDHEAAEDEMTYERERYAFRHSYDRLSLLMLPIRIPEVNPL